MKNASDLLQKIATDLNQCDLGLALTKGATRRKYAAHQKACYAAIKEMNIRDGLVSISDEELLAELGV